MTPDAESLVALLRGMLEKEPEWRPDMRGDTLTWELHGQTLRARLDLNGEVDLTLKTAGT